MKRQSVLAIAGWCVAAVVAVAVGVTAVTLLGTGITSDSVEPVSQESAQGQLEADRAAARTPPASPGASASAPEPAPPDGAQTNPDARKGPTKVLQSAGGSLAAYCAGDQAVLAWWTPAQGYSVDDVEPGPDDDVSVEFEHGEDDVEMRVACAEGAPALVPENAED